MAAETRARPTAASDAPSAPPVGVAIATRDRRRNVVETVLRLRALPEQPPVVVVDNASSDGTAQALQGIAGVEVIRLAENRGAAARNDAARRLGTPLVAFSDDDSWWEPGALRCAADLFKQYPEVGLVAARILVGPEGKLDPACSAMALSPLGQPPGHPGPAILGFVACGAIVRRSAFLSVGGFNPLLHLGCEETLLSLDLADAGWKLAYADDVVAHHHPYPGAREGRRALELRNLVLIAWLRCSRRWALALSGRTALSAIDNQHARVALGGVARLSPELLRRRRRLSVEVERQLELIEGRRPHSARRLGAAVFSARPRALEER